MLFFPAMKPEEATDLNPNPTTNATDLNPNPTTNTGSSGTNVTWGSLWSSCCFFGTEELFLINIIEIEWPVTEAACKFYFQNVKQNIGFTEPVYFSVWYLKIKNLYYRVRTESGKLFGSQKETKKILENKSNILEKVWKFCAVFLAKNPHSLCLLILQR